MFYRKGFTASITAVTGVPTTGLFFYPPPYLTISILHTKWRKLRRPHKNRGEKILQVIYSEIKKLHGLSELYRPKDRRLSAK
jgi:hypothetical protein